jgi:low affinity Fe/Cu permease
MSRAAISHKRSNGSPAAKNSKSAATAKRNNGAQAECGQLAASLPRSNKTPGLFTMFAQKTAQLAGRPVTFLLAVITIIVWAATGPMFGFSDTWQLVINTGTTIVTFLMVFLIQNSQNRDGAAIQVKLDELIRVSKVRNSFVGIEHLTDEELEELRTKCESRARAAPAAGRAQTRITDSRPERRNAKSSAASKSKASLVK